MKRNNNKCIATFAVEEKCIEMIISLVYDAKLFIYEISIHTPLSAPLIHSQHTNTSISTPALLSELRHPCEHPSTPVRTPALLSAPKHSRQNPSTPVSTQAPLSALNHPCQHPSTPVSTPAPLSAPQHPSQHPSTIAPKAMCIETKYI